MNLLQVRTQFVKESGRYDLVVDTVDYVDKGANYYINSGMKMLGKLALINAEKAKLYYSLARGEYSITFQHHCRVVNEIWVNNSEERYQLEKITLNELKGLYTELATSTDNGAPAYYALAELRALETTDQESLGTFINKTWIETDKKYDYRGVIIVPPADEAYVVEVNGLFKNVDLSADADENFWTIEENELLIRAAQYKLECHSRGTENAKNWLSAIKEDVMEMNKDVVEEESYGINQIEG